MPQLALRRTALLIVGLACLALAAAACSKSDSPRTAATTSAEVVPSATAHTALVEGPAAATEVLSPTPEPEAQVPLAAPAATAVPASDASAPSEEPVVAPAATEEPPPATVPPAEPVTRPRGTVSGVTDDACPTDSPASARCFLATVSCPGIADIRASLRQVGPVSTGTVVLTTGGLSTTFYRGGITVSNLMDALVGEGWSTVEIAWASPGLWEGPVGAQTLACRSASLIRWVYDSLHQSRTQLPFVATGTSNGAGQIAFALSYYDLWTYLDAAVLTSGPPFCPACCPGCVTSAAAKTEPFMSGSTRMAYPRTMTTILLGANDTLPNVVENAKKYYAAISTAKSLQVLAGVDHALPQAPAGAEAILAAIRAARR